MIECFERINELNNAIRLKVLVIAVQMTVMQLQKCSSPGSTCKTIKFASINSKKKRLRSNERAVFDESLIIEWVTKYLRSPSLHTMRPHQTPAPGPREPRPSVWARGWDQLSHWHRPESYLATQLKDSTGPVQWFVDVTSRTLTNVCRLLIISTRVHPVIHYLSSRKPCKL